MTILIGDDDPDDLFLITTALREIRNDLEIITVNDGTEIIEQLQSLSKLPDLIIMDNRMPKMDGEQTLRKIKECGHTNIPVIIYSTLSSTSLASRYQSLGVAGIVVKPNHFEEIKRNFAELMIKLALIT